MLETSMKNTTALDLLKEEFGTLSDLLQRHASERPNHVALRLDGASVSYATLEAQLNRVSATLQRDGLGRGDVVAISATTSLNYVFAFLGSLRAGITVAPLAPDMTADTFKRMITDSGARVLFLDQAVADVLQNAGETIDIRKVALNSSSSEESWSDWLENTEAAPKGVAVQPSDAFNIIYSSGTTGSPKGIVVPHSFRWAQFQLFRSLGYDDSSVAMVSIPLYSNMTLSSFLPPLAMGCEIVLMSKFDPRRYLELAERHRVTHSMMVPVQFQRILAVPDFEKFDLSSFRVKSCGSAHFAASLKAEILDRWPGDLIEYFGMTEGGGVCVLEARKHRDKLHTVGKPAPGHDMRVIDEDGRELPVGSIGEIVGRSPTMMVGYHNLPEKTREAEWFDADGERFIRTGDVGKFDSDGFLTLLDRRKDMIISGGFNIYPSDVEAVLREHPGIDDVAVAGVPSSKWGETPVAFIIRGNNADDLSPEEVMAWSRGKLNKSQRLSAVEFVDELPRNGIGKVLKRTLRDRWVESGKSN
jgi:long-chain acyl-CoA synthetase